jgi:hypothetical protein
MSSPISEKMKSQYPEQRKCDINSKLFLKTRGIEEMGGSHVVV